MTPAFLLIYLGQAIIALAPLLVPGHMLSKCPVLLRILLGLIVLGFGGFFLFGFLATFEPLDPAIQWGFRIFYLLAGLASLAGAARLFLTRSPSACL